MEILKIIMVALVGVTAASLVKSVRAEVSLYIVLATGIIILIMILNSLTGIFRYFEAIYNKVEYGREYFPVIIKVLVIAYLSDFTSQLCRDAGQVAIGTKVELAGKLIIFFISIPILASVISLIDKLL